jgi:acyl carrier protein
MDAQAFKQLIIDWLDDNYHFGDAAEKIGTDEDKSFLQNGILDSMGFVKLVLFIEQTCKVQLDRKDISPANLCTPSSTTTPAGSSHGQLRTSLAQ